MTRLVARVRPTQFFTTGLVLFGAGAFYFIGYSDAFATVYQKGMAIATTTAEAIMAPTWPATLDKIAYNILLVFRDVCLYHFLPFGASFAASSLSPILTGFPMVSLT